MLPMLHYTLTASAMYASEFHNINIGNFLVLLMGMSGCTGVFDDSSDEEEQIILNPDLGEQTKRSIGSPNLLSYSDCSDLEESLKLSIEEETRTSLIQAIDDVYYWGGGWMEDDMVMESSDGDASPSSSPKTRTEGSDFSGTNNQEQGVDEADFVKTDGYHIYFLDNGLLHIMDIPEFGEIEHASSTEIEGTPVAMMLNDIGSGFYNL